MSIGEVLASLVDEFDDISVSKIRFLESAGLIEPERTASGYRKFYPKDVERLQLILRLQRDAFLPLKVIRERLDQGLTDVPAPVPSPSPVSQTPEERSTPVVPPSGPEPAVIDRDLADALRRSPERVELTEADLGDRLDLELGQIQQLQEFNVICAHHRNGTTFFDADDLTIAEIARDLMKLGIEPRHMKTLRRIAEQEADMLGQMVAPALRNRRPEARDQAIDTLGELWNLARDLRAAYVRQMLRAQVAGDR